jgi:hypothetical protein
LSKMDGSAKAAELAEDAQGLLARLETDVEQYVRLRLASEILGRAVESYRERHQGPIMRRSSELFAHLTSGSFAGLRLEFNEKGDAILVGVRPGGKEIVGVEGMSDGTTDQLYLAVRLASLETYLENNEPGYRSVHRLSFSLITVVSSSWHRPTLVESSCSRTLSVSEGALEATIRCGKIDHGRRLSLGASHPVAGSPRDGAAACGRVGLGLRLPMGDAAYQNS